MSLLADERKNLILRTMRAWTRILFRSKPCWYRVLTLLLLLVCAFVLPRFYDCMHKILLYASWHCCVLFLEALWWKLSDHSNALDSNSRSFKFFHVELLLMVWNLFMFIDWKFGVGFNFVSTARCAWKDTRTSCKRNISILHVEERTHLIIKRNKYIQMQDTAIAIAYKKNE